MKSITWFAVIAAIAGCGTDDPPAPASTPPPARRTLTLLTNDRVTVDRAGHLSVAGRPGVSFIHVKNGDHTSVFPSDALPLVHAGLLDPRLFDVTQLLADGYDRLPYTPLIVKHDGTARARSRFGATARDFRSLGALAVHAAPELWRSLGGALPAGVTKIWLDGTRTPTLDVSVPLIGAPIAWAAGFDGTGVTVAVLDTGIDAAHPDLATQVIGEMNFTATDPFFGEDGLDHVGHGTHVASTIAGTGAASNGRYRGVAPGAHLLDGKVCSATRCTDSSMLAGMEWAAQSGAKVINMSIGGGDTPGTDPLEDAVNTLTAQYGVLFVISSGNDGQYGTVNSPGSAEAALTVGAFDKQDQLASFSSRGPRRGDSGLKPEIVAPGVDITAARSQYSEGAPGTLYATKSGTSMAAPHVAGSAAILVQRHPTFTPAQLKATLIAAAKPNPAVDAFAQGGGRVDIGRAIGQQITTEPAAFSCGLQAFPHGDDTPVATTVTYRNAGASSVALAIAVTGRATNGSAAPAGMFTASVSALTVPAGGSAALTVTCDSRVGTLDGAFGGELTATAPGVTVQTPFGIEREPESYDLTVTHTDRAGNVPDVFFTYIGRAEDDQRANYIPSDPVATLRLPKGSYVIHDDIMDFDADGNVLSDTFQFQPSFALTADRTIAFDARAGQPITVTVPKAQARPAFTELNTTYWRGGGRFGFGLDVFAEGALYSAQLGAPQTIPRLETFLGQMWAAPGPDGTFANSPYSYTLFWYFEDRMPTGFVRHLHQGDLATIRSHYATQAPGDTAGVSQQVDAPVTDPGIPLVEWFAPFEIPFALPSDRTDYVNIDGGQRWAPYMNEYAADGSFVSYFQDRLTAYHANTTYTERWVQGVFGPSASSDAFAERGEDELFVYLPWLGDAAGRYGFADDADHTTRLFANGVEVPVANASGTRYDVAPGLAHYRYTIDYERLLPDYPSSHVSAAWTFDSAHTATSTPLPLSGIQLQPALDDQNTARGGIPAVVPVVVTSKPESAAPALHAPTVDVSYDDGATWHGALVLTVLHHSFALLLPPHGPGWVSFRASATNGTNNSVTETIIRAYRLR